MPTENQFTQHEWQLLLDTPALVGAAVMVCSGSGLGTLKEAVALTRGLLEVPAEYEGNPLIQSVVEARKSGSADPNEWQDSYQGSDVEQLKAEVLGRCETLANLLDQVRAEQDAYGFKCWIHTVATRVANAAREGGFLGFGGQRVSSEEERLLAEIATTLRIQPA